MVRLLGKLTDDGSNPRISRKNIKDFFRLRAAKVDKVGYDQAVIYQDKNPRLAEARDAAEKNKLFPLLRLQGTEAVLDVGCGTGRWTDQIAAKCSSYLGTDLSSELIDIAVDRFASVSNVSFMCLPSEEISIKTISKYFDVILSLGLFIYLNDDELVKTIRGYASVAKKECRILIREPVGITDRLTIVEHYSDDMEQLYNAIYRTEEELYGYLNSELYSEGFRVVSSGDVYQAHLNNRKDTKQRWLMLER